MRFIAERLTRVADVFDGGPDKTNNTWARNEFVRYSFHSRVRLAYLVYLLLARIVITVGVRALIDNMCRMCRGARCLFGQMSDLISSSVDVPTLSKVKERAARVPKVSSLRRPYHRDKARDRS